MFMKKLHQSFITQPTILNLVYAWKFLRVLSQTIRSFLLPVKTQNMLIWKREKRRREAKIDEGKNPTLTQKGGKSLATYYKAVHSRYSILLDSETSDVEKLQHMSFDLNARYTCHKSILEKKTNGCEYRFSLMCFVASSSTLFFPIYWSVSIHDSFVCLLVKLFQLDIWAGFCIGFGRGCGCSRLLQKACI